MLILIPPRARKKKKKNSTDKYHIKSYSYEIFLAMFKLMLFLPPATEDSEKWKLSLISSNHTFLMKLKIKHNLYFFSFFSLKINFPFTKQKVTIVWEKQSKTLKHHLVDSAALEVPQIQHPEQKYSLCWCSVASEAVEGLYSLDLEALSIEQEVRASQNNCSSTHRDIRDS